MPEITPDSRDDLIKFLKKKFYSGGNPFGRPGAKDYLRGGNPFGRPLEGEGDLAEYYADIAILLSDWDRMFQNFKDLSNDLETVYGQLDQLFPGDERQGLLGHDNLVGKSILILCHMNGWKTQNSLQLLNPVDPRVFYRLIKAGFMWRDLISLDNHGQYSHCIQWLIIKQYLDRKNANIDIIDLYRKTGEYMYMSNEKMKGRPRSSLVEQEQVSLWVFLVDCFSAGEGSNYVDWREHVVSKTCRSPSKLDRQLRHGWKDIWLADALSNQRDLLRRTHLKSLNQHAVPLEQKAGQHNDFVRTNPSGLYYRPPGRTDRVLEFGINRMLELTWPNLRQDETSISDS